MGTPIIFYTPLLIALLALAGLMLVSWALNHEFQQRHKQWWGPPLALLYVLGVAAWLWAHRPDTLGWSFSLEMQLRATPWGQWNAEFSRDAAAFFDGAWVGNWPLLGAASAELRAYFLTDTFLDRLNLALLAGFIVFKLLARVLRGVWCTLSPCPRWRGDPFYRPVPGQGGQLLVGRWEVVSDVMSALRWVGLIAVVLALAYQHHQWNWPFPLVPVLALVLWMECHWYFAGPRQKPPQLPPENADAPAVVQGDYAPLVACCKERFAPCEPPVRAYAPTELALTRANADIERFAKALSEGSDVLATSMPAEFIEGHLRARLLEILAQGKDAVLVAPDVDAAAQARHWLQAWLGSMGRLGLALEPIRGLKEGTEAGAVLGALRVACPHELLHAQDGLRQLGLVVLVNVGASMADAATLTWALHRVRLASPTCQLLMLGDAREYLEDALKKAFPLTALESIRPLANRAARTFVMSWPAEANPPYQDMISRVDISNHVGAENVLACVALAQGADTVRLCEQGSVPWKHYRDKLDNYRNHLSPDHEFNVLAGSALHSRVEEAADNWLAPLDMRSVLVLRETRCNLPAAIVRWADRAQESVLLHVVSAPYMMRDYFADNLSFYIDQPLLPLSPKPSPTQGFSWALAHELARPEGLREDAIRQSLQRALKAPRSIEVELPELLGPLYGSEIPLWVSDEGWQDKDGQPMRTMGLAHPPKNQNIWKTWKLQAENGALLGHCSADEVFQRFQVEQIHSFNGHPYRVKEHNESECLTLFASATPRAEFQYRSLIDFTLTAKEPKPGHDQLRGQWRLVQTRIEGSIDANPKGFFRFDGTIVETPALGLQFYDVPAKGSQGKRTHQNPVVWRFEFKRQDTAEALADADLKALSKRLAFLLTEMVPTLFAHPYAQLYILAPEPDSTEAESPQHPVRVYSKRLSLRLGAQYKVPDGSMKPGLCPASTEAIEFYVLEDSGRDLGLAHAFMQDWPYIFNWLDDYIAWELQRCEERQGAAPDETPGSAPEGEGSPELASPPVQAVPAAAEKSESPSARTRREAGASPSYLAFGEADLSADLQSELRALREFFKTLNMGDGDPGSLYRQRARFLKRQSAPVLPTPSNPSSLPSSPQTPCPTCGGSCGEDATVFRADMTIRQRQGERVYRCAVCGREEISDERRLKGALEQARQSFVRVFSLKPPECDIAFMETDAQDLALTGESEWEVIPAVMPQGEADVHRPAALLKMKGAPEVPEASVAWAQEVLHRLVGNQQSVAAGEGFVREKRSFRVLVPMRTPYRFACQLIVQQLVYAWVIDHVNLPGFESWVRAQLPWRKRHLATTLASRLLSEKLPRADGSSPAPAPAEAPTSQAGPDAPLNPSAQQTPQEPDDTAKVKVAFEARLNPEKPFIEAMAERWPQESADA